MSAAPTYTAQPRTVRGSHAVSKLRQAGLVPLTISRAGHPSQHLALDVKSASHLAAHVIHICTIELGGKRITTLRGEVVKDCMNDSVQHIDLLEVDEKAEIKVDVEVHPDARDCAGVKSGGIVEQRLRKVKVRCRADAIPDEITVDLKDVELNQTILVDKCVIPPGVVLVTPPSTPLISVVIPRGLKIVEEEAAKETAVAGAEGAVAPAEGAVAPAEGATAPAEGAAAPAEGKAPAAKGKEAPAKKEAAAKKK